MTIGGVDRAARRGPVRRIGRRVFLFDLGRGSVAAVVGVGLVACGSDSDQGASPPPAAGATRTPPAAGAGTPPTAGGGTSAPPSTASPAAATPASAGATFPDDWRRVVLGGVSAYVLVRNGEAAVVDTGVRGSAGEIEAALVALGAGWDAVGHVIVTHAHPDHQGSLQDVLAAAGGATGYAGRGDIAAITSPRAIVAVGDGDRVFDLEIIETPGHTPGHIAVLDAQAGILLAGDALNGVGGEVAGPIERFTQDMPTAIASAEKLGGYQYDTIVFGHGEPVIGDAADRVAALAATL